MMTRSDEDASSSESSSESASSESAAAASLLLLPPTGVQVAQVLEVLVALALLTATIAFGSWQAKLYEQRRKRLMPGGPVLLFHVAAASAPAKPQLWQPFVAHGTTCVTCSDANVGVAAAAVM